MTGWLCAADRFLAGDDKEAEQRRSCMFKLIPSVVKGSWVIKQAVGNTPVLLGKKLTTRYYRSTLQQDQQDTKCNNDNRNNTSHGDHDNHPLLQVNPPTRSTNTKCNSDNKNNTSHGDHDNHPLLLGTKCNNDDKSKSHGDHDSSSSYKTQQMLSVCGLSLV